MACTKVPARVAIGLGALLASYLVLLVPDFEPASAPGAAPEPFLWHRDDLWQALEARFAARRDVGCAAVAAEIDSAVADLGAQLDALEARQVPVDDPSFNHLERTLFDVAPAFGACPARVPELAVMFERIRGAVKLASRNWDATERASRDRLYRLLYGGRATIEELLLQMPASDMPALVRGTEEPCAGPSAEVQGVRVCSGDLIVSRGGAPTSALIARGNDYPGNFSHVALTHVGEDGAVTMIEAHIERGVATATLDEYLADKKLRLMALRLRSDHPALATDPMLAHHAATAGLTEARARHVPYDFAMDYHDHAARFCSEVASAAYEPLGIRLWQGLSSMSTPGVVGWLGSFGVRHFTTQAPADLEYDPQLVVVAEWHDPEALARDHIHNAIIDAMLEEADRGDSIPASRVLLPLVRVAKAWSALLNLIGRVGPVPEGMTATVALRADALRARHGVIEREMEPRIAEFREQTGYAPPYWRLVDIARKAAAETPW